MLKKTITYNSLFTDEPVVEDHYFHISKADLVTMEMEEHKATYVKDGEEITGMQAKLQKIVDSEDGKAIMEEFKDIIRRAYGKKDGDRFLKSKEISEEFLASEAYSELIYELCTDAEKSAAFVNGIVPGNLEQIAAEVKREAAIEETTPSPKPAPMEIRDEVKSATPENPVELTQADLKELPADKLQTGLADGRYKLS